MAKICSECFGVVPSTERGRCPGCARAENRRRNRARPGYPPEYRRNRAIVLAGSPPCHWCGSPGADTADHVIAIAHGGTHDVGNLVPSCRSCNSRRGGKI